MPFRKPGPPGRGSDAGGPDEPFALPWGPPPKHAHRHGGAPGWRPGGGPPRWGRRRWGLRRRLSTLFAFVALAAVSLTTLFTLGAVADLQRALTPAPGAAAPPFGPSQRGPFGPPWRDGRNDGNRGGAGDGAAASSPAGRAAPDAFRRVWRTAMLAALLSFLLASVTAAAATRRLTRPLAALTDGARRLAEGERGVRVRPPAAHDELRTLTLAFNALTEGLERQEAWRRDLVADIAHDLRTPLSVMRAEIEALQDGIRARDDAALARLHGEVMTLSRLVSDLRTLSLAEGGGLELRPQRLAVAPLLAELADAFAARAAALGAAIEVDAPEPLRVHADRAQLQRLLANLLDNALRYAPGAITLGAAAGGPTDDLPGDASGGPGRGADRDPNGDADGDPDGGSYGGGDAARAGTWLWVRDRGRGLAPAELERVFERFRRGDPARTRHPAPSAGGEAAGGEAATPSTDTSPGAPPPPGAGAGSGLGLAIVRAIAEAHGGRVRAENVANAGGPGGARFAVWLPAPAAPGEGRTPVE